MRDEALTGRISLEKAVLEFEWEIILDALKQMGYVQGRAASLLGSSRRMLKCRMDMLGISRQTALGASTLIEEEPVSEASSR